MTKAGEIAVLQIHKQIMPMWRCLLYLRESQKAGMPERKGDVGGAQDGASERTETATGALEFMRTSDFALEVRWVFGT